MPNGRRTAEQRLLPEGAPAELRAFVGCTTDTVRLDLEETDWLPAPGGMDAVSPEVTVEPGSGQGQVTVTASWGGFIEVRLPLSVVDGKLEVDTSEVPPFLSSGVRRWVDDLNEHLEANGKGLGPIQLDGSTVALQKIALAPAGEDESTVAAGTPAWEEQWEELDARSRERADELDGLLEEDDAPIDVDLDFEDGEDRPESILDYLDEHGVEDSAIGAVFGRDAVRVRRWQRGVIAAAAAGTAALLLFLAFGSSDPRTDEASADPGTGGAPTEELPSDSEPTTDPTEEPADDGEQAALPARDDVDAWRETLSSGERVRRAMRAAMDERGAALAALTDARGDVVPEERDGGSASGGQLTFVAQTVDYDGPDVDILSVTVFGPVIAPEVVEELACGAPVEGFTGVCDDGPIADEDHALIVIELAGPVASGGAAFYGYTIGWQSTPDPSDDFANGGALDGFDRWMSLNVDPERQRFTPIEVGPAPFVPMQDSTLRWVVAGDLLVLFHPPGAPYGGPLRAMAAAFDSDGPPALGVDQAPDDGFLERPQPDA